MPVSVSVCEVCESECVCVCVCVCVSVRGVDGCGCTVCANLMPCTCAFCTGC